MNCKKCKAALSEDSVFCSKCGTKVEYFDVEGQRYSLGQRCSRHRAELPTGGAFCSSYRASVHGGKFAKESSTNGGEAVKHFFSRHKLPIAIVAAVCCILIIGTFLLRGGPKSEKEIILDLPEEVTVIRVDNEPVFLEVKELEIEKRKTKDGLDTVYCVIKLESDLITMTSYKILTYSEYDDNNWYLETITSYKEPVVNFLKGTDELYYKVIEAIERHDDLYRNFESSIIDHTVFYSEDGATYSFNFAKQVYILNLSGTLSVTISISGNSYYGYHTYTQIDSSGVDVERDMSGS